MVDSPSRQCRQCDGYYTPSAAQFRRGERICRPCKSDIDRARRERRKAAGLSVSGKTMPIEYQRALAERLRQDPDYRKRKAAYARVYQSQPDVREKNKCRKLTRSAIDKGILVRQPCQVCGEQKVQAHHDDYSKPLDVQWLCVTHHAALHATARATMGERDV